MTTYKVHWSIEVEADSAEQAARMVADDYFNGRIARTGECVFDVSKEFDSSFSWLWTRVNLSTDQRPAPTRTAPGQP